MANATNQLHTETGQDSAQSASQRSQSTSASKNVGPSNRVQHTFQDGTTTVQERPAILSTTTQDTSPSVGETAEDFSFTLGFTIKVLQRRPCKRIPTD